MKKRSLKQQLLLSVTALLLCVSMFVGSTFAWFTDSVTSTNNIIKSGNLDVSLEWLEGDEDPTSDTAAWMDASKSEPIFNSKLWEPGYTAVRHIKIENEGSLALKYVLTITAYDGTTPVAPENVSKLADVIDVYYADPAQSVTRDTVETLHKLGSLREVLAGLESTANGALKEKGASDVITLALKMREDANNDYQDLSIGDNFSITLFATQLEHEEDSFDETYDEGAIYYDVMVSDAAELMAAISAGNDAIAIDGKIALTKSIGANNVTFVAMNSDAGIDFGTYGISGYGNTFKNLSLDNDRKGWYEGMQYSDGENTTYVDCVFENGVTTYGDSTFVDCTFNELPAGNYALFVYDGKVINVDGCTFNYGNRAIKIYNEGGSPDIKVNVKDTSFVASATSVANKAMIEIDDSSMKSVTVNVSNVKVDSKISAQGIYRINDGALNTSTSKSVVTVDGVVTIAKVANQNELKEAIANGAVVELTSDVAYNTAIKNDASINLNGNTFEATATINLDNNADLTMTGGNYEVNGTYGHVDVRPSTEEGSVLVFEDVDFSFNKLDNTYGPSTNRLGSVVEVCATVADANTKILFKNCTFDNAQVIFEGMGGKTGTFDATFEGCTFNALTSSAPIYVQNYVTGTINVKNCTFNLECTSSTASAISISSSSSTSVTLNAENNTLNAKAATPYTFDASKGETSVNNVKVNGTPVDIKFVSAYGNSTLNVTGITGTGIAAK